MKPLDGIKVIDLSTLLPGPLATLILAEAGAEVIKVERIGGEDMRRSPPFIDGESILFAILNRGKRSIELNIKSKEGYEKITKLIKSADVVVDQYVALNFIGEVSAGYELHPGSRADLVGFQDAGSFHVGPVACLDHTGQHPGKTRSGGM